MKNLILLALLLVCLASCGRKGPLEPPEARAPVPVVSLEGRGEVDAVVLSWKAPLENAKGDRLIDLDGYTVKRSTVARDARADFDEIAVLNLSEDQMARVSKATDQSSNSTVFSFRDTDVTPGARYEYIVKPFNEAGVHGPSTAVLRVRFIGESSVIELR